MRDGGGLEAGFRLAIEEGLITGPRLVLSLSIMSPTGGIGDRVSPSGHTRPFGSGPGLPSGVADGVEAVRTAVRTLVRAGADVIKCATTGGASSRPGHGPKDRAFGAEEMRALVAEAHELGRRVMCHAVGGPGLRLAVEAGVDSVEHGACVHEDTPSEALVAATGLAAECLGLEREIGTVEKGKRADLVVADGDPLKDVRVLQDPKRIRFVIKDGVIVGGTGQPPADAP